METALLSRVLVAVIAIVFTAATTAKANCSRPGQYDSHVLALTWQPGFCETRRGKECAQLRPGDYTTTHLALHGLWPNKKSCGYSYGFCATAVKKKRPFCRYPRLALHDRVRADVERVMPNARLANGCLQRHEYWKHGSCRDKDPNNYFQLAVGLTDQVNASPFVSRFLQNNIGRTVSRKQILRSFEDSFGRDSSARLQLVCKRQLLVELRITLPRRLLANAAIAKLIKSAPRVKPKARCPARIIIDAL